MSTIEDPRKLLQDCIAPEIRAIEVRLSALEKNVERIERKINSNHQVAMVAIRGLADYISVLDRLSRLEAKQ